MISLEQVERLADLNHRLKIITETRIKSEYNQNRRTISIYRECERILNTAIKDMENTLHKDLQKDIPHG